MDKKNDEAEKNTVDKKLDENFSTKTENENSSSGNRSKRENAEISHTKDDEDEVKFKRSRHGTGPPTEELKEERKPKKKVAVLFGYCGTGFHGLQYNPPHKTIESEVFKALCDAGAVSKANSNDPRKSALLRAARTDKGVHAAGNIITMKLIIENPNIINEINKHLPETIRIWNISKVNKSFEPRKVCDGRIYEYLIPSYSFIAPNPATYMASIIENSNQKFDSEILENENKNYWDSIFNELKSHNILLDTIKQIENKMHSRQVKIEDDQENDKFEIALLNEEQSKNFKLMKEIESKYRKSYRISNERLVKIRHFFKLYEGTHNFHNFTLGKDYKDPSAKRLIRSIIVSDPIIINGTEWLSIKLNGQSFMLHQIRKMISLVALMIRYRSPSSVLNDAYSNKKISIPKAPSLGLLLERPLYDEYNKRLVLFEHDPIDFEKSVNEINAFKEKYIYKQIYDTEEEEAQFNGFFRFVDYFGGDQFTYLIPSYKSNSEQIQT